MQALEIQNKLACTRFAGNEDIVGKVMKHLTAYGEAYLFDGGSDYDWRVSKDRNCEDKSCGDHWLVAAFISTGVI
jgi:hypothetical protein